MRQTTIALLAGGVLLSAGYARADTTYTVDKITITGSKTVPTAKLLAATQEHAGSQVTTADIVADQDAISKVLAANNVVGGIKTSMVSHPKNHIVVMFVIDDKGAQAPVVTTVAPKLHLEIFDGNKSIDSDKLAAAAGLKPGDDLTDQKISAAQQAIVTVYKAAKLPLSLKVSGETRAVSAGKVDVLWHVVETKSKPEKSKRSKDAEDEIQSQP